MARGFGATLGVGSTDKITTALTSFAAARTFFCWTNRNGHGGGGFGRVFQQESTYILFDANGLSAGNYRFQAGYSSNPGFWDFTAPSGSAWSAIAVALDQSLDTNDPVVFVDGAKLTVGSGLTESSTPSGTATDLSGNAFIIGNRSGGDRAWDGLHGEFAGYHAILSDGEMAALCAGYCPLLVRPNALVEYVPMLRNNVSRKLAAPTLTGTAVQPHCRVIYPRRRAS